MKIIKSKQDDNMVVLHIMDDKKRKSLGVFVVTDKSLIKSIMQWDVRKHRLVFKEVVGR